MTRFARTAAAIVGIAATVVASGVVPHATADTLASAQARAAALTKSVNALQTQAEVASERYDEVQGELNIAVAERGQADQALTAIQASANAAQQGVANRATELYESGGAGSIIASVLSGDDPNQAVESYRLANDVLRYQSQSAEADSQTVEKARLLDQRDASISRHVTQLQVAQQAAASQVQSLLATQRKELAAANGTVRRIMRADEAAAAAASAQDFVGAVRAAGGTIDTSQPATPPNAIAAAAIAAAHSRLGVPYVWGATGPDEFDCSGLTQWSYAHAGVTLPRTAAEQWTVGPHPSLANLEPGDLLFWALNTSDPATIHHVAMYIGHGLMIAAPHTGENVQIQPVYLEGFIGAMRPWANPTNVTG
jgi:peptidoglycan DL-endopeptidase CwlO